MEREERGEGKRSLDKFRSTCREVRQRLDRRHTAG